MKRKNFFSLALAVAVLFSINLFFISCDDDSNEEVIEQELDEDKDKKDDGVDDDEENDDNENNDDTSSFNADNFIASFEQMFVADNRWSWDFSHDFDGSKLVKSYQNYAAFGDFGDKFFEIEHTYDDNGVIVSSERKASGYSGAVVFEYEYDDDGFIVVLTKKVNDKIRDVVAHEYNEQGQLVKKIHEPRKAGEEQKVEEFTYNSEGFVESYKNSNWKSYTEYFYQDGMMQQMTEYHDDGTEYTSVLSYDSQGRLIKGEDPGSEGEYSLFIYSESQVVIEYYEEGHISSKEIIGNGFLTKGFWDYEFEMLEGSGEMTFQYAIEIILDDNEDVEKRVCYEGALDNLIQVGYALVDERDPDKDNEAVKEVVYSAGGQELYYVIYELEYNEEDDYWNENGSTWYTADGVEIDFYDIDEKWVEPLMNW